MQDLSDTLIDFHQDHLLDCYNTLDDDSKKQLRKQLETIEFGLLQELFALTKKAPQSLNTELQPHPWQRREDALNNAGQYTKLAEESFKKGQIAIFLVAGGQGSRLGFEGPKGVFNIGLPSNKSIFQIHAEKIKALGLKYGKSAPWYIMTSPLNYDDTTRFFKDHHYFGIDENNICFFNQGMLPALDTEGRILLEKPDSVALVPDGNGGCFKALRQSGALADMKKRGITQVFLYGVDNVLCRVGDPLFMGFHKAEGCPAASKAVKKAYPEEKVGIFALLNGKPGVLEYSDMDDDVRFAKNADGNLRYDGGNIAAHAFTLEALENLGNHPLPYHVAFKKVATIDKKGNPFTPENPNAYKFEQFLFDAFARLGTMGVQEVLREEEFAPVKNKDGLDSPQTARDLILNLHTQWLRTSGCEIPAGKRYEISPLLSLAGENLNPEVFNIELGKGILAENP